MSRETMDWLNENTLIGFTDKRGNAWHHRQGADNHYPGAIPVEDVERRLFSWTAEESPLYTVQRIKESGFTSTEYVEVPGHKAITRSDTGAVLGIHSDRYQPHQLHEWLIGNVNKVLDDDLQIASAGLLKGGAVAWLSVEVPDTIVTPEGVRFRPGLMVRHSFDGSISTTYGRHITNVVCDNTMAAAAKEHGGQQYRVKSTRNGSFKIGEAREALGIVYGLADDFAAEVKELCATAFPDARFTKLVEQFAPVDLESKRSVTMGEKVRDSLYRLWEEDERVTPWRGTAFGAWQAVNTYQQHESRTRGTTNRVERNMLRAIDGTADKADALTLDRILSLV